MSAAVSEYFTQLLDLQVPGSIDLSTDGKTLVYTTSLDSSALQKDAEHRVTAIWHAESGRAGSARQLTSGSYEDKQPALSPDAKTIAFISDRAKQGETSALYLLSFSGGEPYAITPKDNEQAIGSFKWSPDGRFLAYISADEKTKERKDQLEVKDDPIVYGENFEYHRLRILHIDSRELKTIVSINEHITCFDWSIDGQSIAFNTCPDPSLEVHYTGEQNIYTVAVDGSGLKKRASLPAYISDVVYGHGAIYFRGPIQRTTVVSAFALYELRLDKRDDSPQLLASGEVGCCWGIKKVGNDIGYQVQSGMNDQLYMYGGQKLIDLPNSILDWTASFTKDSDEIIVAVVKGDMNRPAEVYTTTASGGALVKLSNHGSKFQEDLASTSFIDCQTFDGTERIEAVLHTPILHKSEKGLPTKPLSTLVVVHGGPYTRSSNAFNPSYFYWANAALKAGYAVMLPNYRGSSGRGHKFASYSQGGLGVYDQPDVVALTQHCIEQGYTDKENILICGWSQGGHLTYINAVRNGMHGLGWRYKAGIAGAGITDWDTMAFTSDIAFWEAEYAGAGAWSTNPDDISGRSGSAIWELNKAAQDKILPAMLLLHGREDLRVPIEQARAFRRGLQWHKIPFESVEYPREGHVIRERRHLEDMLRRVSRFTAQHLKAN